MPIKDGIIVHKPNGDDFFAVEYQRGVRISSPPKQALDYLRYIEMYSKEGQIRDLARKAIELL